MKRLAVGFLLLLSAVPSNLWAANVAADSARGAQLFEALSCVQCHSINGKGGTVGPDLGRRIDRSFTPATLAATMWNHAPAMWAAMRDRNIRAGDLDEQAAADLFAYFYSAHFFDRPGDAGRGKNLFGSKHCAECHGLTQARLPTAKPVAEWESIGQPVALVSAMWNHAATMKTEFARRKFAWPELTSQDLTDMLVYLRNLPAARGVAARTEISSGAGGEALFQSKGCSVCHTGRLSLGPLLKNKTLTDIAAAMWNHEPRMAQTPAQLDPVEMLEIVSYLWAGEFFEDSGKPTAGGRVFAAKHCTACHNDASSGAPALPSAGRSFTGAAMVSALWRHGPRMMEQMNGKHIAWPRFDGTQMADVIAFLNSAGRRKP
ncbi:MAG TPA: c-type cytochrome [Bryobacteraceae bacterium]|nr:c-type cytochrome [Bryobacteraceae bacterium]